MSQAHEFQELHTLVGHALLTGLCPLIPIPFLDDWVRDVVRRRLIRQMVVRSDLDDLDPSRIKVLACGHDPFKPSGCVAGCFYTCIKLPAGIVFNLLFKKILRKIVFVLALKDCVDTFSATFHESFLVQHALDHTGACRYYLPPQGELGLAVELRRHIEAVRDEVDHRPVERWARQAFRGSRKLLKQTARTVAKHLRALRRDGSLSDDEIYDEMRREEGGLGSIVDELTEEIGSETSYLQDLRRRLDQRLESAATDSTQSAEAQET